MVKKLYYRNRRCFETVSELDTRAMLQKHRCKYHGSDRAVKSIKRVNFKADAFECCDT